MAGYPLAVPRAVPLRRLCAAESAAGCATDCEAGCAAACAAGCAAGRLAARPPHRKGGRKLNHARLRPGPDAVGAERRRLPAARQYPHIENASLSMLCLHCLPVDASSGGLRAVAGGGVASRGVVAVEDGHGEIHDLALELL